MFAEFVAEEVDKVEMLYTRFVSLISSRPVVQSLLPLSPAGQARAAPRLSAQRWLPGWAEAWAPLQLKNKVSTLQLTWLPRPPAGVQRRGQVRGRER